MTTTRRLRLMALANGEAADGAITCRRISYRRPKDQLRGKTIWAHRFIFKLNGNVVSEKRAAQWLNPDNANF